jgi:capsule biosynthesis phosphatase
MKKYCFDIDGTICTNTWGKYEEAVPFFDRIEKVNKLYDDGHYIIYFTARGMGVCDGNISKAYKMWFDMTSKQLNQWGCKFNELLLGKPNADYYIDDKGISDKNFF